MEFFKNNIPAYKSARSVKAAATQPAATNGLSGLLGSLFGSATPAYKTSAGQSAKASSSSNGLLSMFAVVPSYKTATPVAVAEAFDDDALAEAAEFAQVAEAGDPGPDDEGAVCELAPDEIVLL
ncbi:MAG: hypothetical protein M3680_00435 [Myxococcota bacterium]|nr:hypothetical protein [Myxococcota bacterium]